MSRSEAAEAPPGPFVVSCEHAGTHLPGAYLALLAGAPLRTHEGHDLGALAFARTLAAALDAPLLAQRTTRLLVDANRSETNRAVFSRYTHSLPRAARERLLARRHRPHREAVRTACEAAREAHGVVVHVAVHSFTPVLEGRMREVDIGVLYDPARDAERRIAGAWVEALKRRTDLRVRRNQPYRGATDGLPTALRRALGEGYAGFELELSQGLWLPAKRWPRGLVETVSGTLRRATG